MEIFLKVYEIKSLLSVQALMVFKFTPAFVKEKKIVCFRLLILKHLVFLKIVPKAASNFCSFFPSPLLVDFHQCTHTTVLVPLFMADFQNNF
jgi:hypothetical protein